MSYEIFRELSMSYEIFRELSHPAFSSSDIITDLSMVNTVECCREIKRGFWQKLLWVLLWDHNPWPYSPVEFYEVDIPAIVYDARSNSIICHPSLEHEIKKAIAKGI